MFRFVKGKRKKKVTSSLLVAHLNRTYEKKKENFTQTKRTLSKARVHKERSLQTRLSKPNVSWQEEEGGNYAFAHIKRDKQGCTPCGTGQHTEHGDAVKSKCPFPKHTRNDHMNSFIQRARQGLPRVPHCPPTTKLFPASKRVMAGKMRKDILHSRVTQTRPRDQCKRACV